VATFYRTSTVWAIEFQYDGHPRRWLKSFAPGADVPALVAQNLRDLHGDRARLVSVRRATEDEERQYLRDAGPQTAVGPTGRR
jgi:uncharacterized DUF497 family protein